MPSERYKFTEGAFVPNDTYAANAASFQILTGVSIPILFLSQRPDLMVES